MAALAGRSFPGFLALAGRAHLRAAVPRCPSTMRPRPAYKAMSVRAVSSSFPVAAEAPKVNIFCDQVVYKGKGAVALKMIKPTWSRVPTGSGINVAREGTVLLEFASAVGERNYDWENKGTFALSAIECAQVLEAVEHNQEASFFHDPNKGSAGEGQVTKSLKLSPNPQGFFLNLAVNDRQAGKDAKYMTTLTPAEARVWRSLLDFAIPRLLGFDEMFQGPPEMREAPEAGGQPPF